MKTYEFTPENICARKITFALEDDVIHDVTFHGGCGGNSKGISSLLEGAKAGEAVKRLENVSCGNKGTSCPAELAKALVQALDE